MQKKEDVCLEIKTKAELSSKVCVHLLLQIFQHLLFVRQQIPCPFFYSKLKPSTQLEVKEEKKLKQLFGQLQNLFEQLEKLFSENFSKIDCFALCGGTSLVSLKEVHLVEFSGKEERRSKEMSTKQLFNLSGSALREIVTANVKFVEKQVSHMNLFFLFLIKKDGIAQDKIADCFTPKTNFDFSAKLKNCNKLRIKVSSATFYEKKEEEFSIETQTKDNIWYQYSKPISGLKFV